MASLEEFLRVHELQLHGMGFPRRLHQTLFEKFCVDPPVFDAGENFQLVEEEDGSFRAMVAAPQGIDAESNVFLVDHAWSFRLGDARPQLQANKALLMRMARLMNVLKPDDEVDEVNVVEEECEEVPEEAKEEDLEAKELQVRETLNALEDTTTSLELDDFDILSVAELGLPDRYPDLVDLSLWGNCIKSPDDVLQTVHRLPCLKGLWVNKNPCVQGAKGEYLRDYIYAQFPHIEIYNGKFTPHAGEWALRFCSEDKNTPLETVTSVDLSRRGDVSLAKLPLSKCTSLLNLKLNGILQISSTPEEFITQLTDVLGQLPQLENLEVDESIVNCLWDNLAVLKEKLPRLLKLNERELTHGRPMVDTSLVGRVMEEMWKYVQTYRLVSEEKFDETAIWYVMDEFGSAFRHSDTPNFRCAPFLYAPHGPESGVSYSLIWPTARVNFGDEAFRDYLHGITEAENRSARLAVWFDSSPNFPKQFFKDQFNKLQSKLSTTQLPSLSNRDEPLPPLRPVGDVDGVASLAVFSDLAYVRENLTRPEFRIVTDASEADILWTSQVVDSEMKDRYRIKDGVYAMQFPFEAAVVQKHHLAQTVMSAYGFRPWLQPTYELESTVAAMMGDYYTRQETGDNNLWILKPWNMARSIDSWVTGNLKCILRHLETGRKIAQKYIEKPLLFRKKKFDLRFIVVLKSIQPLEVYLYKTFWIRCANHEYTTADSTFEDYQTHFTVMNYGPHKLTQVFWWDFIKEFDADHGEGHWADVYAKIKTMVREVFQAAAAVHPEMHSEKSRTIYGLDVMIDDAFQPKLLEITYCPDCTRACKYDANFYNDIFACLFLNQTSDFLAPV